VQQLDLWERREWSPEELAVVAREIRNLYWFIRNSRRELHEARRRRVYRKIAVHKKTPARSRRLRARNFGLASVLQG